MSQEIADALDAALARMNDNGAHWTQGSYRTFDPERGELFCSVGAINHTLPSFTQDPLRKATLAALAEAVPARIFPGEDAWKRIVVWNDAKTTTWKEVKRVFAEARRKVLA